MGMTLDDFLRTGNMTASALATRTGISEASIARARKGRQNLSLDAIASIVRETDGAVTADDLIGARAA
tara:strand:- start:292 stop:495 length:204 start_codon:yes stop_codon:yes gene_type:complete